MKKIGYLITGLALGLTISIASPVFAQGVKTITAKLNNTVNVLVNGEKVYLNAKPLIYNNLNYLPVAEISQALGLDVSYDKKTDEIRIVNPNANNFPIAAEPVTYNKELKLGESVEFGNIKFTINRLISEPREYINDLNYGLDYEIESLNGSSDGVVIEAQLNLQSGRSYYLNFENIDKIIQGSTIRSTTLYKGISVDENEIPISIKVKLTSYTKTMDILGYATWTL
ncbi:stalk domain-containing protein [Paenibacillus segetis]|uniref:Copper amine oxidase-like N-terminal domain-containing protein n=1 Tax=Paenibacillus segetis TaxID=1325360 RepID=A0ABQ1YKT6_9BACL|nr:stalk domain-containing protein [Paenibacillus segetis]GGH28601.1 hypothetical protein GCM10008013_30740 [Paenibacillus segetis]